MSAPVDAPAGAAAGAAAAAPPARVSEGAPNPERIFTLAELRKYDGSDPTGPIYIGTAGKVFDVTGGAGFYGPGGPYGVSRHAHEHREADDRSAVAVL